MSDFGPGAPAVSVRHRLAFFLTAAVVLVGDVVTKQLVVRNMEYGYRGEIQVFGEWVKLTYIHNTGAAFGLFAGARWPLIAISIVAIGVVLFVALARRPRGGTSIALGLILGGALGNLIDRIRMGQVVDFINVGIGEHRWPFFNVADSGVTVGVLWLALILGLHERHGEPETAVTAGGASDADVAAPSDRR